MGSRALIDAAARRLESAGVETPRCDAELLLAAAAGASRSELAAGLAEAEAAGAQEQFTAWIARRAEREPLQHIVGCVGFRGIELLTDRRALIPRPETELLVEVVRAAAPGRILDVATGGGAVALALADELPGAQVTACDLSPAALALATENAQRLGLASRVRLIESDLLAAIDGHFDAIVANLPYVESEEIAGLQPEVAVHEPRLALDGGKDGLDLVRRLASAAPAQLAPGGLIALEIGAGQAAEAKSILAAEGFAAIESHLDLAGIERVVSGVRPR